jgi:hypothetical protein
MKTTIVFEPCRGNPKAHGVACRRDRTAQCDNANDCLGSWLHVVFTQPGSFASILACSRHVRLVGNPGSGDYPVCRLQTSVWTRPCGIAFVKLQPHVGGKSADHQGEAGALGSALHAIRAEAPRRVRGSGLAVDCNSSPEFAAARQIRPLPMAAVKNGRLLKRAGLLYLAAPNGGNL